MKTFKINNTELHLYKGKYYRNGATYLCLWSAEEGPYADISINLPYGNDEAVIAIDRNFEQYADPEIKKAVMDYLFEGQVGFATSGFAKYALYALKEGILEEIEEEIQYY